MFFIIEHIHNFNTMIIDIKGIDVNRDDEDKIIILLIPLLDSYKHFVDSVYGT